MENITCLTNFSSCFIFNSKDAKKTDLLSSPNIIKLFEKYL